MAEDRAPESDPLVAEDGLTGFLDWFRAVVVAKVADLDRASATREKTPSGLTLLGIVKHLTWVERTWFEERLLGNELGDQIDNPTSFRVEPDDTIDGVIANYEAACDRSRAATTAAASLDVQAVGRHRHFGVVTLRWIFTHMIEETARHVGHMDILRERTDGQVGD